jgi:hypothetical protein
VPLHLRDGTADTGVKASRPKFRRGIEGMEYEKSIDLSCGFGVTDVWL